MGHKSEICDLQQAERSREKASDRAFSRGSLGAQQFDAINRKALKIPGRGKVLRQKLVDRIFHPRYCFGGADQPAATAR